ncbi:CopG family transcriptional regulator [Haloferula chungangensis]|uniref:CopG family transcriptional regulator n=1 Tax=Haloferula chungangensis TaxID=1048331 RepID=A0ABW2LAE6_9BACT
MAKGNDKKKDKRKNTSLRLDSATLKALKIQAIKEDSSIQQIVEQLVEGYLKGKK